MSVSLICYKSKFYIFLYIFFQLTAVVAGLKFLVPSLFQQLVLLEGWHPRVETKITLARFQLKAILEDFFRQ